MIEENVVTEREDGWLSIPFQWSVMPRWFDGLLCYVARVGNHGRIFGIDEMDAAKKWCREVHETSRVKSDD